MKVMKNRRFSTGEYELPGFFPVFLASQAYLAHQRQQAFARQPQVGQRKQRHDLPGVLGETTIANLRIAELPLDDLERVFLIHAIKPFSLQRGQQHRAGICRDASITARKKGQNSQSVSTVPGKLICEPCDSKRANNPFACCACASLLARAK